VSFPRRGGPTYEFDQGPVRIPHESQTNIPVLKHEEPPRAHPAQSGEQASYVGQTEDEGVLHSASIAERPVQRRTTRKVKQFQELTGPSVPEPYDVGTILHTGFSDGSET